MKLHISYFANSSLPEAQFSMLCSDSALLTVW